MDIWEMFLFSYFLSWISTFCSCWSDKVRASIVLSDKVRASIVLSDKVRASIVLSDKVRASIVLSLACTWADENAGLATTALVKAEEPPFHYMDSVPTEATLSEGKPLADTKKNVSPNQHHRVSC